VVECGLDASVGDCQTEEEVAVVGSPANEGFTSLQATKGGG
jgi:hypothetical protein